MTNGDTKVFCNGLAVCTRTAKARQSNTKTGIYISLKLSGYAVKVISFSRHVKQNYEGHCFARNTTLDNSTISGNLDGAVKYLP